MFSCQRLYNFIAILQLIKTYANVTNVKLWTSFQTALPNFTSIKIPEVLRDVKQIPMDKLIKTLHNLQPVIQDKPFPVWKVVLISGSSTMGLGLALYIYCYCKRTKGYSRKHWLTMFKRYNNNDVRAAPSYEVAMLQDRPGVQQGDVVNPSAPVNDQRPDPQKQRTNLYPTTFQLAANEIISGQ